jgi:hypothetical protein
MSVPTKKIEVVSTGAVFAFVFDSNKNQASQKMFGSPMFDSAKKYQKRFDKANKWADSMLAILIKEGQ